MKFLKFLTLMHKINDPLPPRNAVPTSASEARKWYKKLNRVTFRAVFSVALGKMRVGGFYSALKWRTV